MQANAKAKFDETIEIAINLGTNPKRGDQAVRGTAMLPHGTGKSLRVAAFAEGEDAVAATAAGERHCASGCYAVCWLHPQGGWPQNACVTWPHVARRCNVCMPQQAFVLVQITHGHATPVTTPNAVCRNWPMLTFTVQTWTHATVMCRC